MSELILKMKDISKKFGKVDANKCANFDLKKGEIHALLGENGAGKTTLMNVLFGIYKADKGEILYKGERVSLTSPRDAIAYRIGMVHQHFMLIPTMSVVENIILGTPISPFRIHKAKFALEVEALCKKFGFKLNPEMKVGDLSIGQQQRVEILKTLYRGVDVLILDEPTAVLTPQEVRDFFTMLKQFRKENLSVIFISHKLKEVMEISDRITIMRGGESVSTVDKNKTSAHWLAETMVGHPIRSEYDKVPLLRGNPVLEMRGCSAASGQEGLDNIDITVYSGEIVGIAGVDGNGQRELSHTIMGHLPLTKGEILIEDSVISHLPTRDRIRRGIAYIPEDRHKQGLVLDFSISENMALNNFRKPPFTKKGLFYPEELIRSAGPKIKEFDIRPADSQIAAKLLSGGNQQKVILARELDNNPRFILANQPTRGLDIGATQFVHSKLLESRSNRSGVLLISADLEEILLLADRILVIYEGELVGEVTGPDYDMAEIGLMMGGDKMHKETVPV